MDAVNKPAHYQGEIECIECIKASMTYEEFKGYLRGNSFKYLWRYNRKKMLWKTYKKHNGILNDYKKKLTIMGNLSKANLDYILKWEGGLQ
jgi:uncharacterized C2H2 Zn-finger protein